MDGIFEEWVSEVFLVFKSVGYEHTVAASPPPETTSIVLRDYHFSVPYH